MTKTILLAVDATSNAAAAADMARDLAAGTGDRVVVLHVHEFALGRFGRFQVDCGAGQGERVVTEIVDHLAAAGITVVADIRKTPLGHIGRIISGVAEEMDVRMIILGSTKTHDVLRLPFGSVSLQLLRQTGRPVLIVPRAPAPAQDYTSAIQATATASTGSHSQRGERGAAEEKAALATCLN
jgi:nucleotide-binding universal stress UspA family protein